MNLRNYSILACVSAMALSSRGATVIEVTNPLDFARTDEIVEFDPESAYGFDFAEEFVIKDASGVEVPYQITHDRRVIFPASVPASGKSRYVIEKGIPSVQDSLVYGRHVPERKDDMAWENDRSAYRAYGPALQKSGERGFGYDIWTKSVPTRVLDKRYHDDIVNKISFHVDHGDGMDVYAVGPTLGGGTAALLDDAGEIVYPYCYRDYEVLDNGPLRFTVRLVYGATEVGSDPNVVETRVISLDKGSYLNRTDVSYAGLSGKRRIAPGIVVHKQNPDGYILAESDGYMAYSDLTEKADNGNGTIFVGIVSPGSANFEYRPLATPAGDAVGHILAPGSYAPGDTFTYWWGSGWSKGGMPDETAWKEYLRKASLRLRHPLETKLKSH